MKKEQLPKLASKQGSTTGGITRDEALKRIQGGTKMTENNAIATNEWYAKQIRELGEYFIKNAETFANGPEKGCMEIKINIYTHNYSPDIEVTTTHTIR